MTRPNSMMATRNGVSSAQRTSESAMFTDWSAAIIAPLSPAPHLDGFAAQATAQRCSMVGMTEIVCVVDAKCLLGEGTLWDPVAGVLWWVDIWGKAIHRYDPGTGRDEVFPTPEHVGCVGVRAKGGLVISMATGFHFFDPATGRFTAIVDPESHLPDNRFNDGKTDRQGRFWSGTVFEAPGKPLQFTGSL